MLPNTFIISFRRTMAVILSLCLLGTSANIAQAAPAVSEVFAPSSSLPQFRLIPPGRFGRIVDYYDGAVGRRGDGAKKQELVILIQDLHAHYGVQKNIAGLLEYLSQKLRASPSPLAGEGGRSPDEGSPQPPFGHLLPQGEKEKQVIPFALAVEGAAGPVDSSVLALFPDQKIKTQAADYLMREGELTGAEYFAVTRGEPHLLVGVENDQYYTLNRELFRKTLAERQGLVSLLKALQADLVPLRDKIYSQALRDFQKKVDAYDKAEMSTHDFIGYLMDYVGAGLVPARNVPARNVSARDGMEFRAGTRPAPTIDVKRDFPTLASFAANSHFGTMDQIRATTAEFLTQIQNSLSAGEKKDLQSLAKSGSMSPYYLYLRDLVYQKKLFLAVPPSLAQYLEYIHIAQTMGMDRLTHEARELAFRVRLNLAGEGSPARDLVQVQHDLDLLTRVSDLQATEFEVKDFGPRLNQFIALCKTLMESNGIRSFDEAKVRGLISSSIDYYALALMRNKPMVDNTLALIGETPNGGRQEGRLTETAADRNGGDRNSFKKATTCRPSRQPPLPSAAVPVSRLSSESPRPATAVLVAGGFHTAPLTELLRQRNISYIVISPTVDGLTEADHNLYVKRLNGELLTVADVLSDAKTWSSSTFAKTTQEGPQATALTPGIMGTALGVVGMAAIFGASVHGLGQSIDLPHLTQFMHHYPSWANISTVHTAFTSLQEFFPTNHAASTGALLAMVPFGLPSGPESPAPLSGSAWKALQVKAANPQKNTLSFAGQTELSLGLVSRLFKAAGKAGVTPATLAAETKLTSKDGNWADIVKKLEKALTGTLAQAIPQAKPESQVEISEETLHQTLFYLAGVLQGKNKLIPYPKEYMDNAERLKGRLKNFPDDYSYLLAASLETLPDDERITQTMNIVKLLRALQKDPDYRRPGLEARIFASLWYALGDEQRIPKTFEGVLMGYLVDVATGKSGPIYLPLGRDDMQKRLLEFESERPWANALLEHPEWMADASFAMVDLGQDENVLRDHVPEKEEYMAHHAKALGAFVEKYLNQFFAGTNSSFDLAKQIQAGDPPGSPARLATANAGRIRPRDVMGILLFTIGLLSAVHGIFSADPTIAAQGIAVAVMPTIGAKGRQLFSQLRNMLVQPRNALARASFQGDPTARAPTVRRDPAAAADPAAVPSGTVKPAEEEHPSVIGGRYRVIRPIGKGGASIVYLAEDSEDPGSKVVVKLARDAAKGRHWSNTTSANEASILRLLADLPAEQRRHYPELLNTGYHDERPYLVQTYIDKPSLANMLDRPQAWSRSGQERQLMALDLLRAIIEALQPLEDLGIRHRDVKSGNILVGLRKGHWDVHIIDFGISTTAAWPGPFLGYTLGYAPPHKGAPSPADVLTGDTFALGVILFQMATASLITFADRRDPYASFRQMVATSDLPADLQGLINHATAADAADRFQTLSDMQAAVSRLLPPQKKKSASRPGTYKAAAMTGIPSAPPKDQVQIALDFLKARKPGQDRSVVKEGGHQGDTNVAEKDVDELRETHPKIITAIQEGQAIGISQFIHADLNALFRGTDASVAQKLLEGLRFDNEPQRLHAAANLQAYLARGPTRRNLQALLANAKAQMHWSDNPSQFDNFRLVIVFSDDPFFTNARLLAHTGAGRKSQIPVLPSIYMHVGTLEAGRSNTEGLKHLFQHEAADFKRTYHSWRTSEEERAINRLWKAVRQAPKTAPIAAKGPAAKKQAHYWHSTISEARIPGTPEGFDVYQETISMARDLVTQLTPEDVTQILSKISGIRDLSVNDLSNNIYISFVATGSHKQVFKVIFTLHNGQQFSLLLASKKERAAEEISPSEIRDLRILDGKGTPKFGKEFKSDDGRRWYLEEFIEGPTSEDLRVGGQLNLSIRRSMVRTLLAIGVALNGFVPRDFNPKNFIIRNHTEVVMVDIGDRRLSALMPDANPLHRVLLLTTLYARYGNGREAIDSDFILDDVIQTLGDNQGRSFLESTLRTMREMGPERLSNYLFVEGRQNFWSLHSKKKDLKPIIDLSNVLQAQIQRYLARLNETNQAIKGSEKGSDTLLDQGESKGTERPEGDGPTRSDNERFSSNFLRFQWGKIRKYRESRRRGRDPKTAGQMAPRLEERLRNILVVMSHHRELEHLFAGPLAHAAEILRVLPLSEHPRFKGRSVPWDQLGLITEPYKDAEGQWHIDLYVDLRLDFAGQFDVGVHELTHLPVGKALRQNKDRVWWRWILQTLFPNIYVESRVVHIENAIHAAVEERRLQAMHHVVAEETILPPARLTDLDDGKLGMLIARVMHPFLKPKQSPLLDNLDRARQIVIGTAA